ncbi:hypothetical protein AB6A40_005264 [Gnathostoma spinigerum]|uniref:Uncharacterized protein n=1 Tax=Gnathostoma spinigerum TaxID=75299 RepID=A0ABD6EQM1_9BILA
MFYYIALCYICLYFIINADISFSSKATELFLKNPPDFIVREKRTFEEGGVTQAFIKSNSSNKNVQESTVASDHKRIFSSSPLSSNESLPNVSNESGVKVATPSKNRRGEVIEDLVETKQFPSRLGSTKDKTDPLKSVVASEHSSSLIDGSVAQHILKIVYGESDDKTLASHQNGLRSKTTGHSEEVFDHKSVVSVARGTDFDEQLIRKQSIPPITQTSTISPFTNQLSIKRGLKSYESTVPPYHASPLMGNANLPADSRGTDRKTVPVETVYPKLLKNTFEIPRANRITTGMREVSATSSSNLKNNHSKVVEIQVDEGMQTIERFPSKGAILASGKEETRSDIDRSADFSEEVTEEAEVEEMSNEVSETGRIMDEGRKDDSLVAPEVIEKLDKDVQKEMVVGNTTVRGDDIVFTDSYLNSDSVTVLPNTIVLNENSGKFDLEKLRREETEYTSTECLGKNKEKSDVSENAKKIFEIKDLGERKIDPELLTEEQYESAGRSELLLTDKPCILQSERKSGTGHEAVSESRLSNEKSSTVTTNLRNSEKKGDLSHLEVKGGYRGMKPKTSHTIQVNEPCFSCDFFDRFLAGVRCSVRDCSSAFRPVHRELKILKEPNIIRRVRMNYRINNSVELRRSYSLH